MLYNKVKGLFLATPFEKYDIEFICRLTNESEDNILPILDELREKGIIKGKRKMYLTGYLLKRAQTRL